MNPPGACSGDLYFCFGFENKNGLPAFAKASARQFAFRSEKQTGARSGSRTRDQRLMSPLLYH